MDTKQVESMSLMIISAVTKAFKSKLADPNYKFADCFPNSKLSECNIRIIHEIMVGIGEKSEKSTVDPSIAYVIEKFINSATLILKGDYDNNTLAMIVTATYGLGPDFDSYVGKVIRIAAILSK